MKLPDRIAAERDYLVALASRHLRGPVPLALDLRGEPGPMPEATQADPSAEIEARRAARRTQERLDSVPASCSRAFVMGELQGRPSREIIARLSLTPSQFWQCLHKVRRELRAELGITHAHS